MEIEQTPIFLSTICQKPHITLFKRIQDVKIWLEMIGFHSDSEDNNVTIAEAFSLLNKNDLVSNFEGYTFIKTIDNENLKCIIVCNFYDNSHYFGPDISEYYLCDGCYYNIEDDESVEETIWKNSYHCYPALFFVIVKQKNDDIKQIYEKIYIKFNKNNIKFDNKKNIIAIKSDEFDVFSSIEFYNFKYKMLQTIYSIINLSLPIEQKSQLLQQVKILCLPNTLYHFTDINNLISIEKYGGLFSWRYLEDHAIPISSFGGNNLSRWLDTRYKDWSDYVRLSFCKIHPMLKSRIRNKIKIVLLEIDSKIIDSTSFISNMNATDNGVTIKSINTIQSIASFIDLDAINDDSLERSTREYKLHQAEVLIKTKVPIEFIKKVYKIEE